MIGRMLGAALMALSIALGACSLAEPPPPSPPDTPAPDSSAPPAIEAPFDADNAAATGILKGADRVEPLALVPVLEGENVARFADPANANDFVDGFPIRARATELGEPFADKLELFLLNERNFAAPANGVTERCPFEPEVALRAFEGAEWIAVVVDFDCNLMTTTSSQGQLTLPSVSFGPGRDELLEIVKEAFPDDPSIQALR
jgi:hypothetical protein